MGHERRIQKQPDQWPCIFAVVVQPALPHLQPPQYLVQPLAMESPHSFNFILVGGRRVWTKGIEATHG